MLDWEERKRLDAEVPASFVTPLGRKSPKSLYSMEHVTFEEDSVYDQRDAEGFIKLNALRLRNLARKRAERG